MAALSLWPFAVFLLTVAVVAASTDFHEGSSCATWYDAASHGESWVSVADFGARADGESDDTAAIQAAVDSKRGSVGAKRRATVYLPSGDYLVSDTIVLWAATTFVGSSSESPGCRSRLLLVDGAAGFGNASALKPLLVTAGGFNRSAAEARRDGWWHQTENANDVFYNQLHHVDLRLGANPGATGVLWHPAQGTSVRDMNIDARGAYSALDYGSATDYFNISGTTDGGGGGTVESISTVGGRYGVRGGGTNWMFRTLRVANASEAGLLLNTNSWNNVFLDVVVSGSPVAVNLSQRTNNIVMLDSVFDIPAGGTGLNLFAMDDNETGLMLSRVVAKGGDYVVRGPTDASTLRQAASGFTSLAAWRTGGYEYINGLEQRAHDRLTVFGALKPARADAPLPVRPKPRVSAAYNVREAGAVGDCRHDDTAAIQKALAMHDTVFLPATAGQNGGGPHESCYLVSDTLALRSNATLLGEGGSLVKLAPHSPGFGDRNAPKAVLQTEDDASSRSVLMDILLDAGNQDGGNSGAVLVEWRAGQGSLHDVHPRMLGPAHIGIHVTGNGGGFIDNSWVWGADHNQSFGSDEQFPGMKTECTEPTCPGADVGILIDSAGPTYLYGTNSEHHVETSYRFQGASNVFVLMAQNEFRTYGPTSKDSAMCSSDAMQVLDSSNVHVYGVSACSWKCAGPGLDYPFIKVRNTTNVSFLEMYAVCQHDARGLCYMLGAEADDTRFAEGATHVVAAQWVQTENSIV